MEPGRPAADECLPDYFQYIDLVPDEHIVALLERQITETAAYLARSRRSKRAGGKRRVSGTCSRSSVMSSTSSGYPAIARYVSRARTQ